MFNAAVRKGFISWKKILYEYFGWINLFYQNSLIDSSKYFLPGIEVIQSSGGAGWAARGCCDYQLRWSHSPDILTLGEYTFNI